MNKITAIEPKKDEDIIRLGHGNTNGFVCPKCKIDGKKVELDSYIEDGDINWECPNCHKIDDGY